MNFPLLLTRRSFSVGGLSGLIFQSPPPGPPLELLARRSFSAGQPVDEGVLSWGLTTGSTPSAVTYWERTDDPSPDIIQVIEVPAGTWYQPHVSLDSARNEVWFRIEFQLAARDAGDNRTRLAAIISGSDWLSVYENTGDLEITDKDGTAVFAVGAGGVSDAWRVLDGYARSDSGAGDGVFQIWIDGASTPTAEITDHAQVIGATQLLFGLGSVQTATTLRVARMEVFSTDPRGTVTPISDGWASAAPFRIYTPPVSAISVQPESPTVGNDSPAGTQFATLSRTGGAGDGSWALSGDITGIAEVDGTVLRLTQTVTTADTGLTGQVSYTGDTAGGTADPMSFTLDVVDAATSLTLTQTAGGGPVTGQLDATQAFMRPFVVPKTTPVMESEPCLSAVPVAERGFGGSVTRCGFENVTQESDIGIVYVDSLDGGDGVGTFRWASNTDTDNNGNSLSGKKVVVVLFAVSGHADGKGSPSFTRENRWFAGQTAPVDSNGRAGFIWHGVVFNPSSRNPSIYPRRVQDSKLRIEHLTFVDGRVPRSSDGSVSTIEPPYGNLDIFERSGGGKHDVIIRNCHFPFGLDEAVAGGADDNNRCEKAYFLNCLFGPPNRNTEAGKRGYNHFFNSGIRRMATHGCLYTAGVVRNPWMRNYADMVFTNNYHYDCTNGMQYAAKKYGLYDRPYLYPPRSYLVSLGNHLKDGPTFQRMNGRYEPFIGTIEDSWGEVGYISIDNIHNNGTPNNNSGSWTWVYEESDMPLWPVHPTLPVEDTRDYVLAHVGPCPSHPNSVVEWVLDRESAGETTLWSMQERGECRYPNEWPFQNTQTTYGNPQPPTNPHEIGASGRTRMEEWLEAEHIAKGGANEFGFGQRWRFPWGGIVTVGQDGAVSFEPEDMKPGESNTVQIKRADGSEVSITCECV